MVLSNAALILGGLWQLQCLWTTFVAAFAVLSHRNLWHGSSLIPNLNLP